jgi:hypothetical protein
MIDQFLHGNRGIAQLLDEREFDARGFAVDA